MFKANEGPTDRIARAIVGVVLLFIALYQTGGLQILLFVLAAICLLTAVTGFCGIYALFKINTCKISTPAVAPVEEVKEPEEEKVEETINEEEIEEPTDSIMSEPEIHEEPHHHEETVTETIEPEVVTPAETPAVTDVENSDEPQEEKPILL